MVTAHSQFLWQLVDAYAPCVIGYEAPLHLSSDGEGNLRTAWGLSAATEAVAFQASCECLSATPSTIRKAILNDGALARASAKQTVMRFCRDRGWSPLAHNEGDALMVLSWAMKARGCAPAQVRWDGIRFWRGDVLI